MSLPKSFNLAEAIPSLPEVSTGTLVSVRPISGNSFLPSAVIEFDVPAGRGWLDPTSLAIRYKAVTVSDASGCVMVGTPLYTPFSRLQLTIGGTTVDSISQYNSYLFGFCGAAALDVHKLSEFDISCYHEEDKGTSVKKNSSRQ